MSQFACAPLWAPKHRLSKNAVFWPNSLSFGPGHIHIECPRLLVLGSDTEVQKVGKADGLFWTA